MDNVRREAGYMCADSRRVGERPQSISCVVLQRALSLRRHSDAMDSEVDSSTVLLRNNLILHAFIH